MTSVSRLPARTANASPPVARDAGIGTGNPSATDDMNEKNRNNVSAAGQQANGRKCPPIEVRNLEMRYGTVLIQRDLNFCVNEREIFVVMGGSGCGKSTLLRHMIGLKQPVKGDIRYGNTNFWKADLAERDRIIRRIGVLYQHGALWSAMNLRENIALPLQEYTSLGQREIREIVELKLSLVGLGGYGDYYPSEISGGMQKRAALARAMALDPAILYFDEPSAGLDPISARRLDDLILELSESLGTTVVVVTHELASIFAIATTAVFLDSEAKTIIAQGKPAELLEHSEHPKVRQFLTRGDLGPVHPAARNQW